MPADSAVGVVLASGVVRLCGLTACVRTARDCRSAIVTASRRENTPRNGAVPRSRRTIARRKSPVTDGSSSASACAAAWDAGPACVAGAAAAAAGPAAAPRGWTPGMRRSPRVGAAMVVRAASPRSACARDDPVSRPERCTRVDARPNQDRWPRPPRRGAAYVGGPVAVDDRVGHEAAQDCREGRLDPVLQTLAGAAVVAAVGDLHRLEDQLDLTVRLRARPHKALNGRVQRDLHDRPSRREASRKQR